MLTRLTELEHRTPLAIATEISRLVREGTISPGERLPTVREVAAGLAVSAGTVSAAWRALADAGLIVSRGRSGTFVRSVRATSMTSRLQGLAASPAARLDLSRGTPDPAMLPSLETALSHAKPRADTGGYHDAPVLPELRDVLVEQWPTRVEALTIVDGALDAISRILELVARFGDTVALESPGFPHFFDLLDAIGVQAVPLEVDDSGVTPLSLARALARKPAAVILQPRAQNPTGVSMSKERARALANVLVTGADWRRITVIEDDHSGLIASAPAVTLSTWLPSQVVHVRSFSKSHGPDLRIAAVSGPRPLIDRLVRRRALGPGWTSRLLQSVLYELLTEESAVARVRTARLIYRDRIDRLAVALRRLGIEVGDPDGINLWLPVRDERAALVRLAASGISAAAGAPFHAPGAAYEPHLRVTAGMVIENVRLVAETLADAASATSE